METQPLNKGNLKNKDASFTFRVKEIEAIHELPLKLTTAHALMRLKTHLSDFEESSHTDVTNRVYTSYLPHGLVSALQVAGSQNQSVKLSISDFLILIGQGLSRHIKYSSPEVRERLINHELKENISIRRDNFVLGQKNDWSSVIEEITKELLNSDSYGVTLDDTSVATQTTQIASSTALMSYNKEFPMFAAGFGFDCSLPVITLKGNPEDWEKLRQKVKKLVDMNKDNCLDLDWWLKELVPVVDKVCDTGAKREVDPEFWNNMYNQTSYELRYFVYGWITVFFPYLATSESPELKRNAFRKDRGIIWYFSADHISEVPFTLLIRDKRIPMKFYSGFLGSKFNEKKWRVKPETFWCVAHDKSKRFWAKLTCNLLMC